MYSKRVGRLLKNQWKIKIGKENKSSLHGQSNIERASSALSYNLFFSSLTNYSLPTCVPVLVSSLALCQVINSPELNTIWRKPWHRLYRVCLLYEEWCSCLCGCSVSASEVDHLIYFYLLQASSQSNQSILSHTSSFIIFFYSLFNLLLLIQSGYRLPKMNRESLLCMSMCGRSFIFFARKDRSDHANIC